MGTSLTRPVHWLLNPPPSHYAHIFIYLRLSRVAITSDARLEARVLSPGAESALVSLASCPEPEAHAACNLPIFDWSLRAKVLGVHWWVQAKLSVRSYSLLSACILRVDGPRLVWRYTINIVIMGMTKSTVGGTDVRWVMSNLNVVIQKGQQAMDAW